jgi:undecaprenyl diphosphate synthase
VSRYSDAELAAFGLQRARLPRHVAVIMDGNGRWARAQGKKRAEGHRAGVERLREIIRFSSDAGIAALTLYAFSSENWARPKAELQVLFRLLVEYFSKEIDELHANQVRIRAIGDLQAFPPRVRNAVLAAELRTAKNSGLQLQIALNYGAQAEILRATRALCAKAMQTGQLPDAEAFAAELYTSGLPALDLLIRSSGEKRVSNFLLYQLAYAELYFTDAYWPDFTRTAYCKALADYAGRNRRFGGLSQRC